MTENPLQNPNDPGKMNQDTRLPSKNSTGNRPAPGQEKNVSNIDNIFSDISRPFEIPPGETGATSWPEL